MPLIRCPYVSTRLWVPLRMSMSPVSDLTQHMAISALSRNPQQTSCPVSLRYQP